MTEKEIIKGCKAKEQGAYKALYDQYGKLLFGMALRYASSNKEAEDILQEAFIKIFQNIKSYADKGSFIGWVKRIVVNTAINSYRSAYQKKIDTYDDMRLLPLYEEEEVFSRFAEEDLLQLLDQLPQGYRIVFNLYVIEGYKHKEIAEMLNISEGTSKSQLSKAKNMLQGLVKQAGIEVLHG